MIASRKAVIVVVAFVLMAIGLPWGGNVPAAYAQISVTAADPPASEQGTLNLRVKITGRGFKNGAKAAFFKTGTSDPTGIDVKSTQYVSSSQVIALIDISAGDVALGQFDIQVANADGRTGKGTELFCVRVKGDIGELSALFDDFSPNVVRSDDLGPYTSPNQAHVGGGVFFDKNLGNLLFSGWVGDYTRLVTFEFDPANLVRNPVTNGTVECRDWSGNPLQREALPAWLPGIPDATWFLIRSEAIVTYKDGAWVSEGIYSNVRDLAVGSSVIVGVNMTFKTPDGREFWLYYNENHWSGLKLKSAQSYLKMTRETATTWVLEPLGPDDPRPLGTVNQAQLFSYVAPVKRVSNGGGCDLGDWLMPFKITFTSVR
jgi:hypothetical protein